MKSFDVINKKNQTQYFKQDKQALPQKTFIKQKKLENVKIQIDQIYQKQSQVPKIHILLQKSNHHLILSKKNNPVLVQLSGKNQSSSQQPKKVEQNKYRQDYSIVSHYQLQGKTNFQMQNPKNKVHQIVSISPKLI